MGAPSSPHDTTARWAAVVVNYESGALLTDTVRSLLADTSAGRPEVVVVDNGSTDGSVDRLRAAEPEVPVVTPGRNVGYAAAANRGTAATRAPVVAVCNCDVQVEPGAAAAVLARFADDATIGAVGPTIRDPDGTHYPSARSVPRTSDAIGHALLGVVRPGNRWSRRYRQLDADPDAPRDVEWVSGASIWLRRRAVDDVGGWDERYFMYVEDVDLCWRLGRAGWRIAYEPRARVTHVHGASTDQRPYRMIVEHHRSLARFARTRWSGARRALLVPASAFLGARAAVAVAARAVRGRTRSGSREVTG